MLDKVAPVPPSAAKLAFGKLVMPHRIEKKKKKKKGIKKTRNRKARRSPGTIQPKTGLTRFG